MPWRQAQIQVAAVVVPRQEAETLVALVVVAGASLVEYEQQVVSAAVDDMPGCTPVDMESTPIEAGSTTVEKKMVVCQVVLLRSTPAGKDSVVLQVVSVVLDMARSPAMASLTLLDKIPIGCAGAPRSYARVGGCPRRVLPLIFGTSLRPRFFG